MIVHLQELQKRHHHGNQVNIMLSNPLPSLPLSTLNKRLKLEAWPKKTTTLATPPPATTYITRPEPIQQKGRKKTVIYHQKRKEKGERERKREKEWRGGDWVPCGFLNCASWNHHSSKKWEVIWKGGKWSSQVYQIRWNLSYVSSRIAVNCSLISVPWSRFLTSSKLNSCVFHDRAMVCLISIKMWVI